MESAFNFKRKMASVLPNRGDTVSVLRSRYVSVFDNAFAAENNNIEYPSTDRRGLDDVNKLIEVLHIGNHAEYRMLSGLLAEIHHTDYRFTNCTESNDVLELMVSPTFDVILLDFHCDLVNFATGQPEKPFPDSESREHRLTASELLRGARAQGCETPIIVMTDEMEADVDREAIRAGASDYLIKGRIDNQLLERTIRYAIERKNAEMHLAKLAHYDPLTSIPNRILFRDRLQHALQRAERKQHHLTLMYMDLNGFKQVNDKFGHDTGDKLLRSCAQRLVECMRKSDSVARIGGDEFTVLLENAESPADIVRIAEKTVKALTQPHYIDNHEITTGCSIGIAVYPSAGKDADSLLRNADMAMYRAKQDQNSCFRFFTEAMNVEARRQFLMEADLQRAVEQRKFAVRYQPRFDLASGRIASLKSHLYWYHPQRGWLDGEQFIPLAEDTGLINELGQWELQQVCQDWEVLRKANISDVSISINLSPRQMKDGLLLKQLAQQRKAHNLPLEAIELDISEQAFIDSLDLIQKCMQRADAKDLAINIKDFGTGFNNLAALNNLNINQFILSATAFDNDAEKSAKMAHILVGVAALFNKHVVANGIDSKNKLIKARKTGCHFGQGNYFGDTVTIDQLLEKFKKPSLAAS